MVIVETISITYQIVCGYRYIGAMFKSSEYTVTLGAVGAIFNSPHCKRLLLGLYLTHYIVSSCCLGYI